VSMFRWGLPFVIVALVAFGCSDNKPTNKLYSVSGKVTLDGEPLNGGVVKFAPDASKGNTQKVSPSGTIDAQGQYQLKTGDEKGMNDGAPAGWYKVGVLIEGPGITSSKTINARYKDPSTSGLEKEVVASPASGAYDLPVTK